MQLSWKSLYFSFLRSVMFELFMFALRRICLVLVLLLVRKMKRSGAVSSCGVMAYAPCSRLRRQFPSCFEFSCIDPSSALSFCDDARNSKKHLGSCCQRQEKLHAMSLATKELLNESAKACMQKTFDRFGLWHSSNGVRIRD
jgi:hypothetical protein